MVSTVFDLENIPPRVKKQSRAVRSKLIEGDGNTHRLHPSVTGGMPEGGCCGAAVTRTANSNTTARLKEYISTTRSINR